MVQEQGSPKPVEVEIVARHHEIRRLFDVIEEVAWKGKMDVDLGVAVSDSVLFLYKGSHFGLHVSKHFDPPNSYITRGLVLDAYYHDELPLHYYPPIYKQVITESVLGILDAKGELEGDPAVLEREAAALRFVAKMLPKTSRKRRQFLEDIPEAVAELAEEVWSGKALQFERAKHDFYEAFGPIREKAKEIQPKAGSYRSLHSEVTLASTPWVKITEGGKEIDVQYRRYDAYSNGSFTDFEQIRARDAGQNGRGDILFEVSDIKRGSQAVLVIGEPIDTAAKINKKIKLLKAMGAAFETQRKA